MEQTRSAQYQRFGNNGEVPWVKCWNTLRKAWRRLICIARSENRRAVDKETRQLIHMWQHVQPVSLSDREKS